MEKHFRFRTKSGTEGGVRHGLLFAGGFGRRLGPLTQRLPKPLLPIGGVSCLERLIVQMVDAGITQISIATHYRPRLIRQEMGDGGRFGAQIRYLEEEIPLGTAGALARVDGSVPWFVVNGDIVTDLDFLRLIRCHTDSGAELTLGTKLWQTPLPFGQLQITGTEVEGFFEKPTLAYWINTGIYCFAPSLLRSLKNRVNGDGALEMSEVIRFALLEKRKVVPFSFSEAWEDIGQPDVYNRLKNEGLRPPLRENELGSNRLWTAHAVETRT